MPAEPYAQLVVSLPWHDKVCDIPEDDRMAAFGLYSAACCYCQQARTDGRIRRVELSRVFPGIDLERIAGVLVIAGLFDADDRSYYVHDYLDHNKSKEQIEAGIQQKRDAGKAGGEASARARAVAAAQAESNPATATTTDTATEEQTREESPQSLSGFPSCMTRDSWGYEREPQSSSAGHIRKAIEKKHGIVAPAAIGALGACVVSACPDGCTGSASDVCARKVIEKVQKAGSLKTAGKWYADDRGLV